MEIYNAVNFAVFAAFLVMSPGPNGVLIAKTVPISGRAAGFANVGGFVGAFYLHGALSIFGISIILVQSAEAFFFVKILGATYLCWIGVKAIYEARQTEQPPAPVKSGVSRRKGMTTAIGEGFLTNALNPKVSMFYLAAFPQFIPTGAGAIESAFFLVVIHSAINAIWFSMMVMLLARFSVATGSKKFRKWLKRITGIVFIGFGVKLATLRG